MPMLRAVVAVCVLTGCEVRTLPVAVSGTVTIDGKPLPKGVITFFSHYDSKSSVASIVNGKYSVEQTDGPFPGRQLVRIIAYRDIVGSKPILTEGLPTADPKAPLPQEQYIPIRYNAESKIEVELTEGSNPDVSFQIESQ